MAEHKDTVEALESLYQILKQDSDNPKELTLAIDALIQTRIADFVELLAERSEQAKIIELQNLKRD